MDVVSYQKVQKPEADCTNIPVGLSDETIQYRYENLRKKMQEKNLDVLVIYGDLEHGSNFEYLTGFLPRFEEALLVIQRNGRDCLVLGNENLNKADKARITAKAIHCPYFSLPNQPMEPGKSFLEIMRETEITAGQRVGIAGWKLFTSKKERNEELFDIPGYIVETVKKLSDEVINATDLFIGAEGIRRTNNVNEIEHYEFGAALASDCMLRAMEKLEVGITEMELGDVLNQFGQKNSVITIAASGPRFQKANLYPTDNMVKLGDTISLTVGYKGGLSSRAGYAVETEEQLPDGKRDYLEKVVKPYFYGMAVWLKEIHCGMTGGELYQLMEKVLPKEVYHWSLCPGHLTADEEWMASPIYDGSKEYITSGMLFQTDIIPSVPGYGGTGAESTVLLADRELREEIREKSPKMWERIQKRKKYIEMELQVHLNEDVLPMCATVAYLRPFLLDKTRAMTGRKEK